MARIKSDEERAREFEELRNKKTRNSKYRQDEEEFQTAQEHFEKFGDLKSWGMMYIKIQKACFNTINKKLCRKIPNEVIEAYSHDITLNIMNGLKRKIESKHFWKIGRLSAFVHFPCMAIYEKQQQFEDRVLDESAFTIYKDGKETIRENEESYFKDGILHL
jgi:hypothetical protein